MEWVQTARFEDGKTALLAEMPALQMEHMTEPPTEKAIEIDSSKKYQTILGFGGAFTEASAINWRLLEPEDQDKVIDLYFNSAEEGGHAYTVGRVPINSCDFSPASYSFDDVAGDMELAKFDQAVQHDVDVGMIPMIKAAQAKIEARGEKLSLYGSPWSPPAWMKLPVGGLQNMTLSAKPNCLMPSMQRTWAKYFSKFIAAYRKHGIDMWGVTVQNEPEASVGWEACLWTPQFMAAFVRDHLGPVLEEEQPGVKIIGFDHNKDHVYIWAQQLYADPEAKKYFAGVGVHWYGGLNTHNLNDTHNLAPDKMILATEACNCGGVVYEKAAFAEGVVTRGNFQATWWSRAEALGLDILADLRYWAVGWTDWNLVLSTAGGPNHLKNLCDANIILDPKEELGMGKLIMQASYYYMGHFSRYIPAGSKRIHLKNTVEIQAPPLEAGDVKNGQALLFAPCDGNDVQKWQLSDDGSLIIPGTDEAKSSEGYRRVHRLRQQVVDRGPAADVCVRALGQPDVGRPLRPRRLPDLQPVHRSLRHRYLVDRLRCGPGCRYHGDRGAAARVHPHRRRQPDVPALQLRRPGLPQRLPRPHHRRRSGRLRALLATADRARAPLWSGRLRAARQDHRAGDHEHRRLAHPVHAGG